MKLVVIEHWRCEESSGYRTLLWANDEIGLEQLEQDVEKARNAYLAVEQEFRKARPASLPYMPDVSFLEQHKHLTVDAALAEWNKQRQEYEEYRKKEDAARRSFAEYMCDLGYTMLEDYMPELAAECDWCHNHGVVVEYGETKADDVPGIVRYNKRHVQTYTAEHALEEREF